jgi:hypothetical protein
MIDEEGAQHALANCAYRLTIDDPNPTNYHSAPAEYRLGARTVQLVRAFCRTDIA